MSQFLNPLPIDVSFRGELPAFDKDNDDTIDLPALSIEAEFKDANSEPLLKYILEKNHIPKLVGIDKFLDVLKKKVIHDYKLPLSAKQLNTKIAHSSKTSILISPKVTAVSQVMHSGYSNLNVKII